MQGKGCLFVKDAAGRTIESKAFCTESLSTVTLSLQLSETALYALGVAGEQAFLKQMLCVY